MEQPFLTLKSTTKHFAHLIDGGSFQSIFFFFRNPIRWCNIAYNGCIRENVRSQRSENFNNSNILQISKRWGVGCKVKARLTLAEGNITKWMTQYCKGRCMTSNARKGKRAHPTPSAMSWTTAIFTHLEDNSGAYQSNIAQWKHLNGNVRQLPEKKRETIGPKCTWL